MKTPKQILKEIDRRTNIYDRFRIENKRLGKKYRTSIYTHKLITLDSLRFFITETVICKCERPIYMIGSKPRICQRCGGKVTNRK